MYDPKKARPGTEQHREYPGVDARIRRGGPVADTKTARVGK
jgi:hypothetical protein